MSNLNGILHPMGCLPSAHTMLEEVASLPNPETPFMRSYLAALAALPLVAMLAAGCSAQSDDTDSSDSDIKKRTNPTGGTGSITFAKPDWYDPAVFGGTLDVYDTAQLQRYMQSSGYLPMVGQGGRLKSLNVGDSTDAAPSTYTLFFTPPNLNKRSSDAIIALVPAPLTVAAGQSATFSPAGIVFEADQPIVWDGGGVPMAGITGPGNLFETMFRGVLGNPSSTQFAGTITLSGKKAGMLLPPGTWQVNDKTVVLEAGKLLALPIVKTKRFAVNLDELDPAYPDSVAGSCVTMTYWPEGANPYAEGDSGIRTERVRALNLFASAVVPEDFKVQVAAMGVPATPKLENGVESYTLNRLELQDVKVGSSTVKGRAKIEYKASNGVYSTLSCASNHTTYTDFDTSTGVDLPDGTYRITSTAQTPSGPITSVEEVSFP